MNRIIFHVELTLDGDPDTAYVQQMAENMAEALQREANEAGLSPDSGPCVERIRVSSVTDPVSGEYFRIMPVEREID